VNRVGKGKAYLVAAYRSLSEPVGAMSVWLECAADFLREWIAPVWPVSVTSEAGHAPQVLLNRLADGWLVTLGNHWSGDWKGRVAVRSGRAKTVRVSEMWAQAPVESVVGEERVQFAADVPAYSLRTYRVRAGR
jgi:hypothetical protein